MISLTKQRIMYIMTKTVSRLQSVLNTYGIVLILWSLYRFNLINTPEWFDEFIAKPLVFLLPIIFYIKRIEKKPFLEQLWLKNERISKDLFIGLSIGAIFIISAFIANYIRFEHVSVQQSLISTQFLFVIIITFATAITEEVFTRGFLLKRIYEEWGNMYSSSFIVSILFLVIHIPILMTNLQVSGNVLLLFFATDFVLSLVTSFVYLDRKSLIAPILIHALYNVAILIYL